MANGSQRGQRTKTACSSGDDGGSGGDDATGGPGEEPTVISQKGDGNGGSKGNMPNIVGPDTRAKNGVLHLVNNVILQKDSIPAPPCTGGTSCGDCKGECQASGGCRFSKTGWCKRDCEERFGWDNGALCPGKGGDDQPAKVCFGGFDCASCQQEMKDQEGCGRETAEEGLQYCEEKWGACYCTGGSDCGSCKGECQNNAGCRFSKTGWCKRDCEERFGIDGICAGGDDDGEGKVCFGSDHCVGCKQECQKQRGCGREETSECKMYCEEKYGVCPYECYGGLSCGDCKKECSDNEGCRFSKTGWCKRDCEERFGWDNGALCPKEGDDDGDDQPAKVCFGGFDCASCQAEMIANEGCGRETADEGVVYCEEKWGACQCTGGTSCGDCKGECSREEGCRFSKTGWCKRDCEERFGKDTGALCPKDGDDDGDDQPAKVCFGSDHCVGCKQEMVDQEGCTREPVDEGLVYCEEKYGKCPFGDH